MYRRIRDLREDHDMTQTQVAKILACRRQVIPNMKQGKTIYPPQCLIRLASSFMVRRICINLSEMRRIKQQRYPHSASD